MLKLPSALALLALTGCAVPSFSVAPRFGTFDVDGDLSIATSGSSADNSLDRLGTERDDSVFGARADLDFGVPHLTLTTQSSAHGGNGVAEATLTQGGVTITAGTPVETDLDLGLHQILYTFDVGLGDSFYGGLGVGVSIVDFEARVEELATNQSVEADETVPVPVLVGRLGAGLGRLDAGLLVSGLAVDIDGNQASFVDLDLNARLHLIGGDNRIMGALTAGWRAVNLDLEYEDSGEDIDLGVEFSGPYIGLHVAL
jgi:hypothetical protein